MTSERRLQWELLLRDSCTGADGDTGLPSDGLHRSHHPEGEEYKDEEEGKERNIRCFY